MKLRSLVRREGSDRSEKCDHGTKKSTNLEEKSPNCTIAQEHRHTHTHSLYAHMHFQATSTESIYPLSDMYIHTNHFHAAVVVKCAWQISGHVHGENLHSLALQPVLLHKIFTADNSSCTAIWCGAGLTQTHTHTCINQLAGVDITFFSVNGRKSIHALNVHESPR